MTFLRSLPPYGPARDAFLLANIAAGMLDAPTWVDVTCGPVVLTVSRDYLSILGERVPMSAPNAQAAVDSLGCLLPTPAIVDAIDAAAAIVPMPTWPGADKLTAERLAWCEEETRARMLGVAGLVAGHRKDVVLVPNLPAGRVVIYGGRWPDGRRIQDVSARHEAAYSDYSHGIRAVRSDCLVDGKPSTVAAALAAGLLGGPVPLRYPTPAETAPTDRPEAPEGRPTDPGPRVLRRGDRGEAVAELQRLLSAAGWHVRADGVFGSLTEAAVRTFQGEAGLQQDALAGPRTMAALRAWKPIDAPTAPAPEAFDLTRAPLPLSDADRERVFGVFKWTPAPQPNEPGAIRILGEWVVENITTITIPQLAGISGTGRVTCHRKAAPTFLRFFAAVEAAGLLSQVLTFDGCWNPRRVRGGESLSNHAWGVDFDINARWNMRGTRGAPKGERGSVVELVPIAVACGLGWGGNWTTPDPMHFGALRAEG